jgi:hypothetical protein
MPLKNEGDFGTNLEGGPNTDYCHYCYLNGEFTNPDLTLEQQIEKLVSMAIENMGMSEKQARESANRALPILKRWGGNKK